MGAIAPNRYEPMPKLFSPRERSLRWHLTAVSVGLLLPTLVFIGVLLWQFTTSERRGVEAQVPSRSWLELEVA